MDVNVLYFAGLRQDLGLDSERIELPHGSTIEQAVRQIQLQRPQLAHWLSCLKFALNREHVDDKRQLAEGDELALLPPFGGG
jgi:MoaE-MoaD fusion protein